MSSAPDNLTDQERRLWEAESKMTPGPWHALLKSKGLTGVHSEECQIYIASFDPVCLPETHERQKADAAGLALARNSVRPLLEEISKLRYALLRANAGKLLEEIARMREALTEVASCPMDSTCLQCRRIASEALEKRKP